MGRRLFAPPGHGAEEIWMRLPRRKWILGIAVVLAILGGVGFSVYRSVQRALALVHVNCSLKQIALSMQQYKSTHGTFPPHAIFSKDGKPLLSWRVAILPYLEEQKLYDEFHLDEPWDSPHNKPLIAKAPLFCMNENGDAATGRTRFVVPVGKDTMFDGDKGITEKQVTDGTSNTVMVVVVAADRSVIWTKPDDLDFDPAHPLAGLGPIADEGIPVAFADGSARNLPKDIDAESFRRLVLRNDGLPIDFNEVDRPRAGEVGR